MLSVDRVDNIVLIILLIKLIIILIVVEIVLIHVVLTVPEQLPEKLKKTTIQSASATCLHHKQVTNSGTTKINIDQLLTSAIDTS